jgi:translation initiation factor IF-1
VVTLPMKTVDDRYIDIVIEPTLGSFIYVHDAGKNAAELFAQGIHLTDRQTGVLHEIARRYNAVFQNGRFQVACPNEAAVHAAILAVSQCVTLAMIEVVTHEAKIEDEPITARIQRSLSKWKPDYVDIRKRYPVKGKQIGAEHQFDFVALSRDMSRAKHVALKILPPSFGARIQADRYGFMVLDIQGRDVADWPRLAIISKVEEWTAPALKIVRELSSDTIEVETEDERRIESVLPGKMTELSEAA